MSTDMIGGPICREPVAAPLIDSEAQSLSDADRRALWDIFVEIGRCWGNLDHDSAGGKSSWLEFIEAKTGSPPSYIGEYRNAVTVVQELVAIYGREAAFPMLFLRHGIPAGPPTTRLAHAKRFVVDEFIRVQVVGGGFRGFVEPASVNYNGFIAGSRYGRTQRSVAWIPGADQEQKGEPT